MCSSLLQFLVAICLFKVSFSAEIGLNGSWTFDDETGEYDGLKATVPGGIFTDLMENGIIDDIHFGQNDTAVRWVSRTNWIYTKKFTVDGTLLSNENVVIRFDGLDTIAEIFLNGISIGTSRNMFVQYIFDIKKQLKAGENTVVVKFAAPVNASADLTGKQNYKIPPECPPDEYNGECHVNQLRKMQASFSWDWGPSFPSVGIWKNVAIEAYNSTIIRYLMVDVAPENDKWVLSVKTYFAENKRNLITGKLDLTIQMDIDKLTNVVDVNVTRDESGEFVQYHKFVVPRNSVQLWWPNGYGHQKLYKFTANFTSGDESSEKTIKIGFRTIKLIQNEIGSGLSFYFVVNDVPIFAKGTNLIPIDILPEKGEDRLTTYWLLFYAELSNMNMLRVWGGGVYQSDYFYETCDQFGILVWQDCMFACSMYPTYEEYLQNVAEEIRHQVKRLNSHPSVALWAANNENELALRDNWYGTESNFTLYKADYLKLYIDTVMPEIKKYAEGAIFLSASPTNGKKSEQEGYVAERPGDPRYGDVHVYNYILDGVDESVYLVPRFASEYGYQSLPSVESLLKATHNISDINLNSTFMNHRQHHPGGNLQLALMPGFQLKELNKLSPTYHKSLVYYTQIYQALSMKVETEHYRSYMSTLNQEGNGMTMGALYWQLNDVWVAPSWSGIDYYGNWKMLQYYMRDSFSTLISTVTLNSSMYFNVHVVSDSQDKIFSASVNIHVYKFDSFSPLNTTTLTVDIEPLRADLVFSAYIEDYLPSECGSLSTARKNCFLYVTVERSNVPIAEDNFLFLDKIKNLSLEKPTITIKSIKTLINGGKFEITLSTDKIAAFVWLDTHGIDGLFSANGFMLVTESTTVKFTSKKQITPEKLKSQLTVTNLLDVDFE